MRGDSDQTLVNEFKRTQFFTKEEKEFLENYKKEKYIANDSYQHTIMTSNDTAGSEDWEGDFESDLLDEHSYPALNYSQLTVVRLKELCRERGLPVSGKKDILIQRLEEDRELEHDIIKKQLKEAREISMGSSRVTKYPFRLKGEAAMTKSSTPMIDSIQSGNVYASALPQMDASRTRNARSNAPIDPAVASHLEALVKEYLTASGGLAGSRDIGRYLAANNESRKGPRSALTELKETYGSLLSFILSRGNVFSVLDKPGYGGDRGFPIKLNKDAT